MAGIDITAIFEPPLTVFPREDSESSVDLWRLTGGTLVRDTQPPPGPTPLLSICVAPPLIIVGGRQDETLARWLRPLTVAAEHGRIDQ